MAQARAVGSTSVAGFRTTEMVNRERQVVRPRRRAGGLQEGMPRMSRFIFAVASLLTVWSSVHAVVRAQTVQVKPWFLVIVDTSGSMQTNCTNGASNPPTCTTCTNGCSTTVNSCGGAHSRINDARCALKNILNSTGDAEFA